MEILLLERSHERIAEELRRIAPGARFVRMQDDGTLQRDGSPVEPGDTAIEIAWASRDLYTLPRSAGLEGDTAIREFMVAILKSETIRWMQSGGAGFDHPIFGMISRKGVRLTNSDSGAVAMAEYVFASVLDVYHPGETRRSAQAERLWTPTRFRELSGTTWLVIGMGNIGREIATRARAFGVHVVGVRRKPRGDEPVAELVTPDAVLSALPRADVVVLCASLNESTAHLVNTDFLRAMRPDSVLVNVARGGLVDEKALLESLERGVPACAVLDVFETEPLPGDSPLWRHERVRVTSHSAAGGSGSTARGDVGFLANLARYVAGEPLLMEVDPAQLP